MYASDDFANFIDLIREARNPSDILKAWNVLESPFMSLRLIAVLPDYSKNVIIPGADIRDLSGKKIVTPYFHGDALHFSSRKLIKKTFLEKEIKVCLDSSIMLDTNIASYISTYVNRKPFGEKNQAEIVNLIRQLLEYNPKFDYNYYLIENSKKLIAKYNTGYRPNRDQLWLDIDVGFKENLIALKLFISIDSIKFKFSGNDSPTISVDEAENEAKELVHNFYFGNSGAIFKDLKRRLTLARILLYKITSIHLGSNEGFKKKSQELIQFMIYELHKYFDREMHIAIRYFKEGTKFTFFKKLERRKDIELSEVRMKIENMAWDLIIPRFIESISATFGEGEFFIPHYLTWDSGLKDSLDMYKAKACIYDDSLKRILTISEIDTQKLLHETIGEYHANKYFGQEARAQRYQASIPPEGELEKILANVESELFSAIRR